MNYWHRVLKHTIKILTLGGVVIGLSIGLAWLAVHVSMWVLIVPTFVLVVALAMYDAEMETQ